LKKDQILNKNIWKSLTGDKISTNNVILSKNLTLDQSAEYDLLKKLSEQLIINNYDRNPTFHKLTKTSTGYTIQRKCCINYQYLCCWSIKINVNTNEATLSCNHDCQHKNPEKRKNKILNLFLYFILNIKIKY